MSRISAKVTFETAPAYLRHQQRLQRQNLRHPLQAPRQLHIAQAERVSVQLHHLRLESKRVVVAHLRVPGWKAESHHIAELHLRRPLVSQSHHPEQHPPSANQPSPRRWASGLFGLIVTLMRLHRHCELLRNSHLTARHHHPLMPSR